MNSYRIAATLLAPLAIQRTRLSNASETLIFLPGSSLRGAFAAKYLRERGGLEDTDFQTLFIEKPVCFPNLLPSDDEGSVIARVLPLTGVTCKRFPGFKNNDSHGVCDTLAKKWLDRNNPVGSREWQCKICDEDMKAITGYWNNNIDEPEEFQPIIFYQRHTGIDRTTGTIASEIFYITQAIADYRPKSRQDGTEPDRYCSQILSGCLYLNDKQYAALEPLCKGSLFAGSDRTRGMGELKIVIEPISINQADIETWDRSFKGCLQGIANGDLRPDLLSGTYFSLKFESPAILVDEFLRPTPELHLDFPGVKPVMKVIKSEIIRGWNDAWQMPKPDDTGIVMGSVYLFRYLGDDLQGLIQYLNRLAIHGIGLRREEGFGQVLICDPFHIHKEVI